MLVPRGLREKEHFPLRSLGGGQGGYGQQAEQKQAKDHGVEEK
jgi:hypothetical protein